jgi:hypothetical protein
MKKKYCFQSEYRKALKIEFSPFAKFHQSLQFVDVYHNGERVYPFELWMKHGEKINPITEMIMEHDHPDYEFHEAKLWDGERDMTGGS